MGVLLLTVMLLFSWMTVSAKTVYVYDVGDGVTTPYTEDDSQWVPTAAAVSEAALSVGGKSAVLMEQESGTVLFEKNSHEKLPIASVTKVMTLLLTMEAIDGGLITVKDTVTCSEKAASMGGSQIWLEPGEKMSVDHLLKAAAVVSANDACAMLAEHICGTIENFVSRMNERAAELGMKDTKFLDCSGLNDEGYSSAHDVAVMSRELMKHKQIQQYTTIWMDTLRDGTSQLVNTNKLVRHYTGATGLKTGTTGAAGHCLSATATRDGVSFVAVILGCESTDERFGGARAMLDYGFANYALFTPETLGNDTFVRVLNGTEPTVQVTQEKAAPILIKKGQEKAVTVETQLAEDVTAPVEKGQVLGTRRLILNNEVIGEIPLRAAQTVEKMTLWKAFYRLLDSLTK
jgi:D-alanyl-D-alanine carboxypeptidase (penicillin-binding protein 5/6)